ncbi:MAG: T9SS type A sorting domain-containing protein, partial [Flavobacteriales bacterium]
SSGSPVADTLGQMRYLDGTAIISDTTGALLLYTNGKTIWNAQHDTMQNGDLNALSFTHAYHSAVIVPHPGKDKMFYVFTADGVENNGNLGIQYSKIDMSLDGGLGSVVLKDSTLFNPCTEVLSAVERIGTDTVWIMTHEKNSNTYRTYIIDEFGLLLLPIKTTISNHVQTDTSGGKGLVGYQFSPDGTMGAAFQGWNYPITGKTDSLELYKFNQKTGVLSQKITIPIDTTLGGLSLSPNNHYLYVSSGYWGRPIHRFDMSVWDKSAILSSKELIATGTNFVFLHLQGGPDGKIYTSWETNSKMSVLKNPNQESGVTLLEDTISLNGRQYSQGLVNYIQSYVNDTSGTVGVLEKNAFMKDVDIYPNPANRTINVEFKKASEEERHIKLINVEGKTIMEKYTRNPSLRLNVEDVSSGTYILEINSKIYKYTQKIQIIKP